VGEDEEVHEVDKPPKDKWLLYIWRQGPEYYDIVGTAKLPQEFWSNCQDGELMLRLQSMSPGEIASPTRYKIARSHLKMVLPFTTLVSAANKDGYETVQAALEMAQHSVAGKHNAVYAEETAWVLTQIIHEWRAADANVVGDVLCLLQGTFRALYMDKQNVGPDMATDRLVMERLYNMSRGLKALKEHFKVLAADMRKEFPRWSPV